MKFSIIVPIYNAGKYVISCFEAIRRQTLKDYEIIFVDDGSTDKSGELCDKIARENLGRVKVLHQVNSRQLISRINGIKSADGEYCVFLDADDCLAENALEVLNEKIEKYNFPDAVIYSYCYEYSNGDKVRAKLLFDEETLISKNDKKRIYAKFLTSTLLNNVWTKAVKRTVLTGGEYPDYDEYKDLLCSEDRLYSFGIIDNANTVLYIDEPLYNYRLSDGSVTRTFDASKIERLNAVKLYDIETDYFAKWEIDGKEDIKRFEAQWFNNMIYVFDKYFNNVKSLKERKRVFNYPWETFLKTKPETLTENEYVSPVHLRWWKWIKERRFYKMELFMLKKRLLKKLKNKKV